MLVVNFGASGSKVRPTPFLLVFFFYSLPVILIFLHLKGQVLVNSPLFFNSTIHEQWRLEVAIGQRGQT